MGVGLVGYVSSQNKGGGGMCRKKKRGGGMRLKINQGDKKKQGGGGGRSVEKNVFVGGGTYIKWNSPSTAITHFPCNVSHLLCDRRSNFLCCNVLFQFLLMLKLIDMIKMLLSTYLSNIRQCEQ